MLALAVLVGWGAVGSNSGAVVAQASSPAPAYPLYAWGYNADGELGNGSNNDSSTPVTVSLPAGVTPTAIAAGDSHNLAIGSDGKLYAWGYNNYGQLGNGTNNDSNTPVVISLPPVVAPAAIAAGLAHNLVIGSDGKLYAWGYNQFGQLGNGLTTNSNIPVTVSLPTGVTPTAIAAGYGHSLAIGSNGKLYAWGYNNYGQLGNGSTSISSTTPVTVSLPAGVTPTAIAAGYGHSLAIGSDGKLYAWGYNQFGQLGNGSTSISSTTPVTVSLPTGVTPTAIGAGTTHSLAIGSDGYLYAWGDNSRGQLGNGSNITSRTPVVVSLPTGVTPTAIATGYRHSLASGSDGYLYAWGYNAFGQLGDGTTTNSNIPLAVGSITGVSHPLLATGANHSLAPLSVPGQIAASSGSPQSAPVGTAFAAPLVATVRDVANNPVGSVTVTFTALSSGASGTFAGNSAVYTGTTDASGLVTATTFTANTLIGSYTVTATISGVDTPAIFNLTNTAGAPANLTAISGGGQSTTVATAFANPLVVSVTDQYNNPVSGAVVTFNPPASGPSTAFQQGVVTATTGADGQATSTALSANTVAGSYTITASVQGQNTVLSASFSLTNTAGVAANITAISGGGQSTTVTTFFANSLVVSVTDQYSNPVSGTLVTFNPPATGASAAFQQGVITATTGVNGQATSARLIATSVAGNYIVTATVSGINTPATFSLTNTPGPVSAVVLVSGDNQQTVVSTTFGNPLVAKVTDNQGNAVSGAEVDFAAPSSGPSATFGGSTVYTATTDATGTLTTTIPTANSVVGSYTVTATLKLPGLPARSVKLAGPRATSVQYHLTNLAVCNPLLVTSSGDDGNCGTLRTALVAASTGPTKTVMINLTAGSVISLTTGLTLTDGVSITTTAPCGVGAGNTMLPPITIRGIGSSSGNGLTLAGHNQLYNLWVRGFSGVQIKAPAGSSTKMQCVRVSKL